MILSDRSIQRLCEREKPMISPFEPRQVRRHENGAPVVSYGLSSAGYDVRLGTEFKIVTKPDAVSFATSGHIGQLDPKSVRPHEFFASFETEDPIRLEPGAALLGRTIEWFDMPRDVVGKCYNKSTYARCFLIVGVTPLEPGWRGYLTIEISNTAPVPVLVYPCEGICQITFEKLDEECRTSYDDRSGKYQDAPGVQVAKI